MHNTGPWPVPPAGVKGDFLADSNWMAEYSVIPDSSIQNTFLQSPIQTMPRACNSILSSVVDRNFNRVDCPGKYISRPSQIKLETPRSQVNVIDGQGKMNFTDTIIGPRGKVASGAFCHSHLPANNVLPAFAGFGSLYDSVVRHRCVPYKQID